MDTLIKDFMSGQMSIVDFEKEFKVNSHLRDEINKLIPAEAKSNPNHPMWADKRLRSYELWKLKNFDIVSYIYEIVNFDGRFGDNLNFFSTIEIFFSVCYPEAKRTTFYHDMHMFFLDACVETYNSPETRDVLEDILKDSFFGLGSRDKRIAAAKTLVREVYHVDGKQRPYWVNGSLWPMGEKSPMKFVSSRKTGEMKTYTFVDVDTGEKRDVTDWY